MSFKIVGIGEVLWDRPPGGRQLGGAPANFTYHATALGLLKGWELDRINDHANRLAAFVCSQAGATPQFPETIRRGFED